VRHWRALGLAGLALGCFLYTTRPGFEPLLGAPSAEVRLAPSAATERLAEALRNDSIPVSRIERRDGYLETSWFDATTGRPAGRSPLGTSIVRVRGWVDPGRIGHSDLRVEVAYRAVRDPSVPERELERAPPADHPVMVRVKAVLDSLEKRFGDPRPAPVVPDTGTPRAPTDSLRPRRDSVRPSPDSVKPRRPSPTPRVGPG
jgi:hypothetical protein